MLEITTDMLLRIEGIMPLVNLGLKISIRCAVLSMLEMESITIFITMHITLVVVMS